MSFLERARNKKMGIVKEDEDKEKEYSSEPQSSTSSDSSSTGSSFLERARNKKATESLEGWVRSSSSLLNEMQSKSQKWSYKDQHKGYSSQISTLLSQADGWRKQYAGNKDAISYINSVVQALSDTKQNSSRIADSYSKYKTQDEYDTAVREYGYWQKWQGKDYLKIRDELAKMDQESEEYNWLKGYMTSTLNSENIDATIAEVDKEIGSLSKFIDQWDTLDVWVNDYMVNPGAASLDLTEEEVQERLAMHRAIMERFGSYDNMRETLSNKRKEIYDLKNVQKYGLLEENEDFYDVSKSVSKDPTAGFGINLFDKFYGAGDKVYDYINDIDGTRDDLRNEDGMNHEGFYYKYSLMTAKEKDRYNYLFHKEGEDSAYAYLKFLEPTLHAREQGEKQGEWVTWAQENGFAADVVSIGASLLSGIGLIDATNQKIGKWFHELNTGEYAGSVDYNRPTMTPANFSRTLRSVNAEKWNAYGQFEFDEEFQKEHPLITAILNGRGLGDVYQLGMSGLDALAAGGLGKLGLPAASALLGGSAGTQGMMDALDRGATDGQAITMGLLNGTFEMFFEAFSIENLMNPDFKNLAHAWAKSGFIESTEEGATSLANFAADCIVMADKSKVRLGALAYMDANPNLTEEEALKLALRDAAIEFGYDVVGGWMLGSTMGSGSYGVNAGINKVATGIDNFKQNTATGRAIMETEGGVDALKALSNEVTGVSAGKVNGEVATGKGIGKLVAGVKNTVNANRVGNLYNSVKKSLDTQSHADIVKTLTRGENGFTEKKANAIAGALIAQANGMELTDKQSKLLLSVRDNPKVQRALDAVINNEQSTMGYRNQKLADFNRNINAGTIAKATGMSVNEVKSVMEGKPTTADEVTIESNYEVSADGKTLDSDGNEINIVGIESTADGKLILKTKDGTIDSSDVMYASEADALIYEAVANLGASPASAWTMIKSFKESDGLSAREYAQGITLAYKYGKLNYKNGLVSLPNQAVVAFQKGREDAEASVKATTQASTESTVSDKNADKKIIFEGFTEKEQRAIKGMQKASMAAIDMINKVSNLEVHVYKSYKKNGKLYAMVNGKERSAPNGYFTDGNKIYIDINAGNAGTGLMLYTMSHEMGHYIAKWNAQDFKAISDFLFEHYGENVPILPMLNYQKEKLKASYKEDGKPIPSEAQLEKEAQEELVCEMLSRMMADKYAYDKLMELKQKDLKLHQKLGQVIKKVLDKIAKAIGVYDTQSPDFMYAASKENFGEEAFRQLQDLYLKAFVQADANFQTAQKNTTDDGGVLYLARDKKNNVVVDEDVDPQALRMKLTEIYNGNYQNDNNYFPVLKNTPWVYRHYCYLDADRSFVMAKKKAYKAMQQKNKKQHALGVDGLMYVIENLGTPNYIVYQKVGEYAGNYAAIIISEEREIFAAVQLGEYKDAQYAPNGEKGYYNTLITAFYPNDGYIDNNILIPENDVVFDIDEDPLQVASGVTPSDRAEESSTEKVPQTEPVVKSELAESGIGFDEETKTVFALRDSTAYKDILTVGRKKFDTEAIAQLVAKGTGRSIEDARKWVNSELSIANLIMANPEFLDFEPDERYDAIKKNSDYPQGTVDLSNLCPKREEFTAMFDKLQKEYPNKLFTAQDIADMRKILSDAKITVACGACFVEDRRQLIGEIADTFIGMWKEAVESGNPLHKTNASGVKSDLLVTKELAKKYNLTPGTKIMATDTYIPNQYDLTTYEGFKKLEKNHPMIAMSFNRYNNSRGQQSARLIEGRAEYKRQILGWSPAQVRRVNNNGGLRIFSFSDFEVVHLLDLVQVIIDCAAKGVKIQGYTKIPAFAKLVRDTGIKLNRSLIPLGDLGYHMENGKVVLDYDATEGIDINDENFVDERDNPNVGNILIGINPTQIGAAMLDSFVDYIIPFHSNKAKAILKKLGTGEWVNYKESQHEKDISTGTASKHNVNIYTEVINKYHPSNKVEFVEAFLEECKSQGKIPRYSEFLNKVYKEDGAYTDEYGAFDYTYREGYHKLIVDFKMFDKNGDILPQGNITPKLDEGFMKELLNAEIDKKQSYEFPKEVYDAIDNRFGEQATKMSDRDSSGRQLSKGQQEFFKDSKVRDANGNLLVVYHGTPSGRFYRFSYDKVGTVGGAQHGYGFYFADNEREAKLYTRGVGTVMQAYLNITNPIDATAKDLSASVETIFDRLPIYAKNNLKEQYGDLETAKKHFAKYDNGTMLSILCSKTEMHPGVFNNVLMNLGYDGIVYSEEGYATEYVAFESSQAKLTTNKTPTYNPDIRYQDRTEDSVSNRSLLANAFEGIAKPEEQQKVKEYKEKVSLIDAEEKKLRELNEQIKKLSFSKGSRDKKKIRDLRDEATMTANRISTMDKILLRLEASKPLQDVLAREKKRAYDKAVKEGRKALDAYKEKTAKTQRELLNRWKETRKNAVERHDKTVMRRKIQSVVGELNDLLLNEDKKRHVPDSLKKAVADALSLVNMDTVGAEERIAKYEALIARETDPDKIDAYTVTLENIKSRGEKMGQKLKDLRDAYEEIQNSDDPDIANGYDPVIAGSLKELAESIGDTALKDMSIEQLSDVYDMYKMVLTRVRDANKSLIESIKESISNRASRVVGEVRAVGGDHKYRASILDPIKAFFWNNAKPVYAMEHIGSSTMTEAFNQVRKGEDTWAKDVTEARAYYLDKSKKYGYDSWNFDEKHTFKSTSEQEFELSLEQIMALYAYSKREQALDHLRLGGFVFDSSIEVSKEKSILKYKVNTADAHQLTPEILANIIGTLTEEQRGFVDEMQDYLSTVMGAKGNEVTMKMYGVKLFKEKFYFPLKAAKQFMFKQNEVAGEVRIKNSGFTNKTKPKANNPVILNNFMDVWANHVNDMSMYHSFVLPLEDFNRIFNYNSPKKEGTPSVSVKGTIQNAYTPAAVNYLKQLITDLNGGARSDPRETFAKSMTAGFKKAKVFSSLSVMIQQPSAIGRAFALVDPKYFHPTVDGMNHDELWAELKQYAPVAIIKEMGYFDTNMGRSTLDFIKAKEYSTFKEKSGAFFKDSAYRDEVLSKAPALADELTWCAIWNAVKRETLAKNPGLDIKSEPFLMLAGARFTEVVTKTQVYDSVLARSANMRSKSGLMSMVTSFMAEPTTSINMLEDALRKRKRGFKGYAGRAFASVAISVILNNALVALVYGMRDDDEDETFAEKYMQALTSGMLDDINPLTYYPFVKDMWSLLQGYDVERSDMSLVSDLADAVKGLVKAYSSEDGDVVGAWHDLVGSVANIGGVPLDNIRRELNGANNFLMTIIEDVKGRATTLGSMGDALLSTVKDSTPIWGWLPGETKTDKLYDAIMSGDTAYVNRLKGSYKDEDAYHNAVRKALRENDPRIMEAAKAGFNGDPSERVRIAKLIIADGFAQDDVVAAINAEINKMKPDEASNPKAKGFYTAEDFAIEIANGDQATANAIKVDVIQTSQKNGKSAEDAEKSFNSSAKSELKDLYMAGKISRDKVISALTTYCGVKKDDAAETVDGWDFEEKHGFTYGKADDAYKAGEITSSQLRTILITDGGMTAEEADLQIEAYNWEKQGYKDVTPAAVRQYKAFCASSNVPKDVYLRIRSFANNTENDKDENGKSINYSAMKKIMAEINAQHLTSAQKDAIARSLGWSEKNINKYKPWR